MKVPFFFLKNDFINTHKPNNLAHYMYLNHINPLYISLSKPNQLLINVNFCMRATKPKSSTHNLYKTNLKLIQTF